MTFQDYINNPLGKENAVISHREMYRNMFNEKLNKIMVRENGKIDYALYETNSAYICHMKVPSEVITNFYYDVIVQLKKEHGIRNLVNSEVKFYSNDPSFVFTFAHAFIKNKMFVTELEDKMSKKAVMERADERNPKNQVGYVKSLYFAYIMMNQRGLFNVIKYEAEKKVYTDKILKSNVMHADEKIKLRQEAQTELDASKKKKKDPVIPQRRDIIHPNAGNTTPQEGQAPNIRHTGVVGSIQNSKSTVGMKTVKKTKRI